MNDKFNDFCNVCSLYTEIENLYRDTQETGELICEDCLEKKNSTQHGANTMKLTYCDVCKKETEHEIEPLHVDGNNTLEDEEPEDKHTCTECGHTYQSLS